MLVPVFGGGDELGMTAGTGVNGDPDEQPRAVSHVAVVRATAELNEWAKPDHRGPRRPDPRRADGDRQPLTPPKMR